MKAELVLPNELIEEIAQRVVQLLKPVIISTANKDNADTVMTPESLAQYLHVEISWIYKQVSNKSIPYFKSGKYVRFKKTAIDKWIETQSVRPISDCKYIHNIK